jgi:5,10-methylenetetrahydromethanopterin reductase
MRPQELVRIVRKAEEIGFSHAWVGDSQVIWREAYVSLAACAVQTSKIKLGICVTNPLTRHLTVTASAMITLSELSDSRAILGISGGDSAVETIGMQPATIGILRESIESLRALFRGHQIQLSGKTVKLNLPPSDIPIYIGAPGGRKKQELAGELADGVLLGSAIEADSLSQQFHNVKFGALKAKKVLENVDLVGWWPFSVSQDGVRARLDVRPYVARVMVRGLENVSKHFDERALLGIRKAYDYSHHMDVSASFIELIPEKAVDMFSVAGNPQDCLKKIELLSNCGLNQFAALLLTTDVEGVLKFFSDQVIPSFG